MICTKTTEAHLLIFVHTTATETRPNTINDNKILKTKTVHFENHNHLSHWETNNIFGIAKSQIMPLTIQGWTSRNIVWLVIKRNVLELEKSIF